MRAVKGSEKKVKRSLKEILIGFYKGGWVRVVRILGLRNCRAVLEVATLTN